MVVTTVTALAAILVALWSGGAFNPLICGGPCGARAAAAPKALALDPTERLAPRDQGDLASPVAAEAIDANAVRAAVASALASEKLGSHVGFAAVDPSSGAVLATHGDGTFMPASTAKLATAITVLATLNPEQRFVTSTVLSGRQVVLVGGGDPYLMSKPPKKRDPLLTANLEDLAKRTAEALRRAGASAVDLGYDDSLFSGPAVNPAWEHSYLSGGVVTPISALWADQLDGAHPTDPAPRAAATFAAQLRGEGIAVTGEPQHAKAPAGALALASVKGPTVAQAVEQTVSYSDNDAAEQLLRHAAIGAGRPGTFADGVALEAEVMAKRDIDTSGLTLHDGSGLSRKDRLTPLTLAEIVASAGKDPRTVGLLADLPVAHFSGSLHRRFSQAEPGRGMVRAKTGTLSGAHALAGIASDADGTPIAFAVLVDKTKDISSVETEAAIDRVAAALAACRCSRGTP